LAATLLALGPALAIPAAAQQELRVTTPVRLTAEDARPSRTYQSPDMLLHPENRSTVVASSVEMRGQQCRLLRSNSLGQQWQLLDASPMPDPDAEDCFHTWGTANQTPIDWGGDARLYYGLSSHPEEHGGPGKNVNVLVGRSDDLGDSWTTTMVRDTEGFGEEDAEDNRVTGLAAHPGADDDEVYVAWGSWGEPPRIAVSTDGAQSLGDPISAVPEAHRDEAGASHPEVVVDDEGAVYVLFTGALEEDGEDRLILTRSDDRGQTFTAHDVTDPAEPSPAYAMMAWSPEGGPRGSLHVAYEHDPAEQPTGTRDIFYQRSTDGGETWSEPQQLNDDGPDGAAGQYQARVDVAPNGRVDVVWFDFRHGQERYANDVYYTFSEDNGDTWADNVRVTDQSVNRHIGAWSNDFDMRAPPGLASTDSVALVAWSDTRNADHAGESQDIYAAAVQHDDLGSGASALPILLAAVGGLFAAGVLLFGVGLGLRLRGRSGPLAPAGS
jgi:hypothetical protein